MAWLGALLMTVLLGLINVVAGGRFLFFMPSINYSSHLLNYSNFWLTTGHSWLLKNPPIIFPFFVFLTSLVFLIVTVTHVKSGSFTLNNLIKVARQNIFSLCHIINFVIMVILQSIGQPVLQYQYYVSYLLPTAFLAIGSQLAIPLSRLAKSKYTIISATTITLLAGTYLASYYTTPCLLVDGASSIWYAFALLAVGTLCLTIARKDRKFVNTILVGLALLSFTFTNVTLLNSACPNCDSGLRKQDFLAVIKSDTTIRVYDTDGQLRFWYSAAEPLGELYMSLASTHLCGYMLINDKFPEIETSDYPTSRNKIPTISILPGTDIVILSSDKDALVKANTALSQINMKASVIGIEKISQGPITFTMTFIRTDYSKAKP
jgi:hypothetical protein